MHIAIFSQRTMVHMEPAESPSVDGGSPDPGGTTDSSIGDFSERVSSVDLSRSRLIPDRRHSEPVVERFPPSECPHRRLSVSSVVRSSASPQATVIVLTDSPLSSELTDSPRSSTMTEMSNTSTTGSALTGSNGSAIGCHEKRHICFCGKAFPYLSILESHMRCHTGERPFQCTFCDKRFAQKATLQVHERTHTGERPYKCKYCDKTFAQYGTKTVHEKSAHLGIRNYKCPKCSKCLSSPSALYTHKKTHGEKSFSCEFCPKTFTLKNYLKLHVKQVHEQNERKHVCHFCEKSFAYAGSLQVHVRTHTGERPYVCKYCPKAFASQGNLQSHERTHTGERPYSCGQCGRSFIQKSQLTAHEATHNYIPGGTTNTNQTTTTSPQPGAALKKQNEYVCKYCGKRYAYASSLYVHTRLHTGERPFRCGFCDKTFTNQGNMQVHQRVHTGEKPYKCNACDKSYAQKVGLKIHLEQCTLYQNARNPSPTEADDSDESGENQAEKRKRLEDLLPKLFNGRMKPKPTKAIRNTPYSSSSRRDSLESVSGGGTPPANGLLRLPTVPAGMNYSPPTMVSTGASPPHHLVRHSSPSTDLHAFKTLAIPEPVKSLNDSGPYSAFHGVIPSGDAGQGSRLDAQIMALKGLLELSSGSPRSVDIQLNKSVIEHLDHQQMMAINAAEMAAAQQAAQLKGLVDIAAPVPLGGLQALLTHQLAHQHLQHLLLQSEQWCNMLASAAAVGAATVPRYPSFLPQSPVAMPQAIPSSLSGGVFIPPSVQSDQMTA